MTDQKEAMVLVEPASIEIAPAPQARTAVPVTHEPDTGSKTATDEPSELFPPPEGGLLDTAAAAPPDPMTRLAVVNGLLDQMAKTDWAALYASNPAQAFERQAEQNRLLAERSQVSMDVLKDDLARSAKAEILNRRRAEACQAALKRDIPEWSPELAGKVAEFAARDLGVTAEEWAGVTDPRLIKALWMAHRGAGGQSSGDGASVAHRPATTLGSRAPAVAGLNDALSMEEWTRVRRGQLGKAR